MENQPLSEMIETYKNLVEILMEDLKNCREKADIYEKALIRACMYLNNGYMDATERNDYTAMQWEDYLLNEVENVA